MKITSISRNKSLAPLKCALLVFCLCLGHVAKAQETKTNDVRAKNQIMLGAGAVNFIYMAVNSLDNKGFSMGSDTSFFAGITTNRTLPLYYIKYEYRLGKRHTLGANFANVGFTVGGLVRDSFFFNDMGLLTQTSVDFTYRSRSLNLRYNYIFNIDSDVQVYLGLGVGFRGNAISMKTNNRNLPDILQIPGFSLLNFPTMGFESTLGFRGQIVDDLGWYAELGMAKSVFQGGISYRF